MSLRLRHHLASSFLPFLVSISFAAAIGLQAQTQPIAPASSESTPSAAADQSKDQSRQTSTPGSSQDAASDGGGMNFDPATGTNTGPGFGQDPGGFNGGASNGFGGSGANRFGGRMGNSFGGGMGGRGFSGGGLGLGSISPLAGDMSRGLGAAGNGAAAGFFGAVPSFNPFTRGGLSMPMNSSFGDFRFSYQSPFSLSNNFAMNHMNGYGAGFATYNSPHVRDGKVDFSAFAKVGMGSAGGMNNLGGDGVNTGAFGVSRGLGGRGPGASEQPSSSVSLRLAF